MTNRIVLCVLLVAGLTIGCWPTSTSTAINVRIANDLDPLDSDGNELDELHVEEGDRVCWINESDCTIVIDFGTPGRDLFNTETIRLTPGERACYRVYSTAGDSGVDYPYEVTCADSSSDRGGGVATPEVVVDEPTP
jgi:hypothetical protein